MNNSKLNIILAVLIAVALMKTFIFEGFAVRGDSMYPSIQSGDYVLVNKLAYIWSEPERGDVVVARARSGERLVKRVMGLPYEWFDVGNKTTNVDPKEYYLMGDNTEVSLDSRALGAVDSWDIGGRVFGTIRLKDLKYIDF